MHFKYLILSQNVLICLSFTVALDFDALIFVDCQVIPKVLLVLSSPLIRINGIRFLQCLHAAFL